MNRIDFQEVAELRLKESKALLAGGFPEGAYYLAGYAVECALKSCIAKRTREHDFPDKKLVNDSHTHDLAKLLQLAELKVDLETAMQGNPAMKSSWDAIQDWSETSRYERRNAQEASDLLQAIEEQAGGLLPWIRLRW
ncbi:MAG TPA: HEPN domain-containing protein [Terracidiphilus sp.]|nr:HEPN domain-containing protein [Terracidiphilus sp.]